MTLNKLRSLLALTATSLLAGLYSCSSSNPELTIKLDLRVTGTLELLEDHFVHS